MLLSRYGDLLEEHADDIIAKSSISQGESAAPMATGGPINMMINDTIIEEDEEGEDDLDDEYDAAPTTLSPGLASINSRKHPGTPPTSGLYKSSPSMMSSMSTISRTNGKRRTSSIIRDILAVPPQSSRVSLDPHTSSSNLLLLDGNMTMLREGKPSPSPTWDVAMATHAPFTQVCIREGKKNEVPFSAAEMAVIIEDHMRSYEHLTKKTFDSEDMEPQDKLEQEEEKQMELKNILLKAVTALLRMSNYVR